MLTSSDILNLQLSINFISVINLHFLTRLANLFGVSQDVFLRCTDIVMDALVANLHQIITWPKPEEFAKYAEQFEEVGRFFPNVIGAIDGLHLAIQLTEETNFEPSFINYKQFHSMHLQVRRFTLVHILLQTC